MKISKIMLISLAITAIIRAFFPSDELCFLQHSFFIATMVLVCYESLFDLIEKNHRELVEKDFEFKQQILKDLFDKSGTKRHEN